MFGKNRLRRRAASHLFGVRGTALAGSTVGLPASPTLSLTSYTDSTIDVSCTSIPGATGYKFYRDGTLVATQAGTTYQYTGLSALTTYSLTCKAYNGAGDSSVSNTVTQKTNFPTLSDTSKQLIWIDFPNLSYTDEGVTLATAGDLVKVVKLLPGWGGSLGDGYVRQNTSGLRPTLQSTGAQGDGSTTIMSLPATITLTGVFSTYLIASRTASNQSCFGLSKASNTSLHGAFSDGSTYCFNGSNAYLMADSRTTLSVRRWRRLATGSHYLKVTGATETTIAGTYAHDFPFDSILKRSSDANSTNARIVAIVAVLEDVVASGNNTAIEAFILSKYGVSIT